MDEQVLRKAEIRERLLKARAALGEEERREKSESICTKIRSLAEYTNAQGILFYMPIGGEVDVTPLILEAQRQGQTCALPKCGPERSLRLYAVKSVEGEVSPGAMGIPEPSSDTACECLPGDLSVLILPGVAFDRLGRRLGRGAAYYDRMLVGCGGKPLKIAPAYAFQVLGELPDEPHDARVDIIVTENEIIDCRREKEGDYHG